MYESTIVCFGSDRNVYLTYLGDSNWPVGECPTAKDFFGYCPEYIACGPLSPEFLRAKAYTVGDAGLNCCFSVTAVGLCGIH